jgi:hypothetical protein
MGVVHDGGEEIVGPDKGLGIVSPVTASMMWLSKPCSLVPVFMRAYFWAQSNAHQIPGAYSIVLE